MQLWQKKKIAKLYFYITQTGITPKTQVYQSHCDHNTFILSNTFKHYNIVKSVAGTATDLTINYAKFAPLNAWNFAPLHVFIMLR